jgi:hypothetical protein
MIGCLGYIAFYFLSVPIFSIWCAFVLKVLWGWFIAPTFQLPELSLIEAWGISLLISLAYSRLPSLSVEKQREKTIPQEISKEVAGEMAKKELAKINWRQMAINHASLQMGAPAAILITGWVVHFFL